MSLSSDQMNMAYRCDYCQRTFKHKRSRDRHIKIHTGDRRYKCNHCVSAFSRSDHLKIHMKTHDERKPHQCSTCNRGYSTAAALTSHMQNHKKAALENNVNIKQKENIIVKNDNDKLNDKSDKFNTSGLASSLASNSDQQQQQQQVTCGLCGDKCNSLESHIRETHLQHLLFAGLLQNYGASLANWQHIMPLASTQRLLSDQLTANASSVSSSLPANNMLKLSQSSTDKSKDNQPEDSKSLASNGCSSPNSGCDLKVNNSTYCSPSPSTKDPSLPFLCNQCSPSPSFSDFESFRVHLKSHLLASSSSIMNNSGPIHAAHPNTVHTQRSCPYCETIINSNLEDHIINSHLSLTVPSFACESCKKLFTNSDDLTKHLMDYHSHRLYQCSICREMFDTDVTLQVHFTVKHSNQCKVYKCSICNELWSNENDFKHHLKVSHFTNQNLVNLSNLNSSENHHNLPLSSLNLNFTHHLLNNGHHNNNHNHDSNNHHHAFSPTSAYRHLPSSLVSSTSNSNVNNLNHSGVNVNNLAAAAAAFQNYSKALFGPKDYFKCQLCGDEFHIEYLLEKHIESVHGSQLTSSSLRPMSQSPKSVSSLHCESRKRKASELNIDVEIDDDTNNNYDDSNSNDRDSPSTTTFKRRISESSEPPSPLSSPLSNSSSSKPCTTTLSPPTVKSLKYSNEGIKSDYLNFFNPIWNPYIHLIQNSSNSLMVN